MTPSDNTDPKLEEARIIHAPVIETMRRMGYGLLKDGETFYELGYETDLKLGLTFSMHQAYAIQADRESAVREELGQQLDPDEVGDLKCSVCWRTPTRLYESKFYCGQHFTAKLTKGSDEAS